MKLDWKALKQPIVALSPMADMTDSAFCRTVRVVSKEKEIEDNTIVFREMVSAEAVVRGNDKTMGMTEIHAEERPLVQQIFGSEPAVMAESARIIEAEHHPEGFDINMGCPVYKITCNFNGAALMKEPERATQIIKQMKAAITVPLSVKIRAGWADKHECLEFCKVVEAAGADMITIHGRTKMQGYSGTSDWDIIRQVKERLSIPLLANGDIHTAPRIVDALQQTKADGVLIARGALGNPWIFLQAEALLQGKEMPIITARERVRVIKMHAALHVEQYGIGGLRTFRKHISWYLKGARNVKKFREALVRVETMEALHGMLDAWLAQEGEELVSTT